MKSKKREPSREEVDDQKFLNALEGERFRERIEREANEAILCPHCGGCDWKMKPKYVFNWVRNDLIATMVCRECKRKLPFVTYLEEPYPEDDEDDEDSVSLVFEMLGINRKPRRRKLDVDQRLRLLRFL